MIYLKYLWQKVKASFKKEEEIIYDPAYYEIPELVGYCTFFGSRLWGGATPKSDVDFFISHKDMEVVKTIILNKGIALNKKQGTYDDIPYAFEFIYNNLNYSISIFDREVNYRAHAKSVPVATSLFAAFPVYASTKDLRKSTFESLTSSCIYNSNYCSDKVTDFIKEHHPEFLI